MGIIWVCRCFAVRREETAALYSRVYFTHFHRDWDMGLGTLADRFPLLCRCKLYLFPGRAAFFRFRFCFLYSASSDSGNEVENGFVLFLCWVPIHPSQVRLRHCFEYCCIPFSIFWKDPERAPKSPVPCSALALFICHLVFVLQRRHHFFLSSGGNVPLLIAFDMLLLLWNTLILYISMLRMLFSTIHRHICVLWVSSPEMGPGIETCRLYNPCKPAMLRTLVLFSLPFRVKTAISKAKRTWWAAR